MLSRPLESLNSHFILDSRYDNLPVARGLRVLNCKKITVENADIFHAVPCDPQEIIRIWGEKSRGQFAVIFDVFRR